MAWGAALLVFFYGFQVARQHRFPYNSIVKAVDQVKDIRSRLQGNPGGNYIKSDVTQTVILHRPAEMAPGMTLVVGVGPKGYLYGSLIDADGRREHTWDLDWYHIWPNPTHIPSAMKPKDRPGTDVHGIWMSRNGDLTFNYNNLGMVQVDVCGRVKWRLPHLTHHSVDQDEAGNFWAGDLIIRDKPDPGLPNYMPVFNDNGIVVVSPNGQLLRRISVFDLLKQNHLQGLLYMSAMAHSDTTVCCDMLHENDVEVFKSTMKPDLFQPGDVMVSLRNLNTVLVFDPKTMRIKQLLVGHTVRQHDPDFLDGSTISVFDNNNVGKPQDQGSSRIIEYSFKTGQEKVLFQGVPATPFYTNEGGKQQRLANGNLLLNEMTRGRALEVTPRGELVWEYFNHADKGLLGALGEAYRVAPDYMSVADLKRLTAQCPAAPAHG